LDSGRGDVEFACVFASVASMAVSFVSKCIFWNPAEKNKLKDARAMEGICFPYVTSVCHTVGFCLVFNTSGSLLWGAPSGVPNPSRLGWRIPEAS